MSMENILHVKQQCVFPERTEFTNKRNEELYRDRIEVDFNFLLESLYKYYLVDMAPISAWKDFIMDYEQNVWDEICSFQSDDFCIVKEPLYMRVQNMEKKMTEHFLFHHAFVVLENEFERGRNTFEKARFVRDVMKQCKNCPSEFLQFQHEHWECFFEIKHEIIKHRYEWSKILSRISYLVPFETCIPKLYELSLEYYRLFMVDFECKDIDRFLLCHFSNKYTNVDDNGILWVRNEKPYSLNIDGKPIDENSYASCLSMDISVDIFEKIPIDFFSGLDRSCLMNFCHSQAILVPFEVYHFVKSKRTGVVMDVLKECFHIVARFSDNYIGKRYHKSLKQKVDHKMLVWKQLHLMPKTIMFPEFFFQTKEIQKEWDIYWNQSFVFFMESFLEHATLSKFSNDVGNEYREQRKMELSKEIDILQKKQDSSIVPFLYGVSMKEIRGELDRLAIREKCPFCPPIFEMPTTLLKDYIGKEPMVVVLNKKKTYSKFFQIEDMVETIYENDSHECRVEQFLNSLNNLKGRHVSKKRDNYFDFQNFVRKQIEY